MRIDKRAKNNFKKSLRELAKFKIQIGAVGAHDNTTWTNSELLAAHEFGRGNLPASAPIARTMNDPDIKQSLNSTIQNLIKVNYDKTSNSFKAEQIAEGIGLLIKQKIKNTIMKGLPLSDL